VSVHYQSPFYMVLAMTLNPCSLGKSGLKVSKVILGAMSYGDPAWQDWVLEEEEALPLLEYAYKAGINTWDTVYSLAS
jgi:aryl-alcohol dehydrogenase-like predicted oxidoreductase